jgi:two-component system sensor kinase FixL
MLGRHFQEFVAPAEIPRVLELFSRTLQGDEVGVIQYEALRADGRRLVVETKAVPVREPNLDVAIQGVIRDVTDRIEADERRQRTETELAHVARLSVMGELVAGIGHELNQPLHAILNFSGACRNILSGQDPLDRDRLREWTEEITNAADRAGAIVAQLRTFTRRAESNLIPVELNTIVEESLRLLEFEARRRSVQVTCHLPSSDLFVSVDRLQIQQVLVNLLRNAFDALADVDVAQRRVQIHGSMADGEVEVCVADNGSGLPDTNAVRIFEPFVTTKPEGLGMGLAISRTIVEAHGGRLWAKPSTSGGAAFHFTLPARKPTGIPSSL